MYTSVNICFGPDNERKKERKIEIERQKLKESDKRNREKYRGLTKERGEREKPSKIMSEREINRQRERGRTIKSEKEGRTAYRI